jgi:hypothetical protein
MKLCSSPASVLSCLATAACLILPLPHAAADDSYRTESHGPRIGTRILYFFKDLAYGENPNDRYQRQPAPQAPARPQANDFAVPPSGGGFSLDQPPPMNGMPPQHRFLPGPQPPQDPPYTYASEDTSPAPNAGREPNRAGIGAQPDPPAPAKVQPKPAPVRKPLLASKPAVENRVTKPAPPRETASAPIEPQEEKVASNTPSSSKRSWQAFGGGTSKNTDTGASAAVENKPATPPPPPSTSAALTGSKTTKEGRVKSPYPPFNELDVTGLPAGSLAMDPTTGKVFRVP